MKKLIALALSLTLLLCAGCSLLPAASQSEASGSPAAPETAVLPGEYPMEFTFSSGAGAWRTALTLNADGSFVGFFHDSDMGDTGPKYPNGTAYTCSFSGEFLAPEQLDEHSYRLQLAPPTLEQPAGQEWIQDGIRYFSAGPHGLEGGINFVLYTPDTPIEGLDEEFLSWWPGRFTETPPTTLGCYGLWNTEVGTGFFTYPDNLM